MRRQSATTGHSRRTAFRKAESDREHTKHVPGQRHNPLLPMDAATADFYKRYAHSLTSSSEACRSAMLPHIERTLTPGASVLDVGAGSGRDVAAMIDCGFDAFGVEPSADMLQKALSLHPSLRGRLAQAALPRLGRPFSERLPGGFDAVVCSAVLMHLEPDEMLRALESMVEQLRVATSDDVEATSPALLVSLPHMESTKLVGQRDADGRQFHNHDADQLCGHLSKLGVSFKQSIDSQAVFAVTGTVWKTIVFRRDS